MEKAVINGHIFNVSSDVLIKSRRNSRYKYFKKIGKKYIMSKERSLKYIASLLWYMNNKAGHVVLSLKTDQGGIITCVYNNRMFDYSIDEIESQDDFNRYITKFRDVYVTVDKYFLYSNIDLPDTSLRKIDVDFLLKTARASLTVSQVITVSTLVLVMVALSLFIYNQIRPKPQKKTVKIETYDDIYRSYVTASVESTVNLIRKIQGVKKENYERISSISGDKITVSSLVYRPAYTRSGLVYTKNYSISDIHPVPVEIKIPWPCPKTVPEGYTVMDIKEENMKNTSYRVKTAVLSAGLMAPEEILPFLYVSLNHCIAVTKIDYSEELREVKIEAVKHYKTQ